MDAAAGQAVLVAYNLPSPAQGHAYQGWMRRGAERFTIGLLAPKGPDGSLVIRVDGLSPSLLSQVEGFGITLEPAGGSQRPTGPQVMTT
jgi:anti-sigma-K factor RskA